MPDQLPPAKEETARWLWEGVRSVAGGLALLLGLTTGAMLMASFPLSYDDWSGWDLMMLALSLLTVAVLLVGTVIAVIAWRVLHVFSRLAEPTGSD